MKKNKPVAAKVFGGFKVFRVLDRPPRHGEVIWLFNEYAVDGRAYCFQECQIECHVEALDPVTKRPNGEEVCYKAGMPVPEDCQVTFWNALNTRSGEIFPDNLYVLDAEISRMYKRIPKGSI